MKTVIAAPVVTTYASILLAAASESAPTLRRSDEAISTAGKNSKAAVAPIEAQPARKIQVVPASPYGN